MARLRQAEQTEHYPWKALYRRGRRRCARYQRSKSAAGEW